MSFGEDGFNLRSGMFPTCSGYWDEQSGQFRRSDSTQLAKCCVDDCVAPVQYCKEFCRQQHGPGQPNDSPDLLRNCLETCNDEREACLATCRLSSPYVGLDNNYIQCANRFGCKGLRELPDAKCVEENKDRIFQCCRDTCIPTRDLDCQAHCEFLQTITIDPTKIGIPKTSDQSLRAVSRKFKVYPDNTWFYILLAVVVSVAIIIVWLLRQR